MRRNRNRSSSKTALQYLMPRPDLVVGALADLGLSDDQIGRYFGVDEEDIGMIPHTTIVSGSLDMSDLVCEPKLSRPARFAVAAQA